MRLWYPLFRGAGRYGVPRHPSACHWNARWGCPQGEKRGGPRGEPVSILVTSWLRLFPRAKHFLPQTTAPARAAVWFVPAAAPLAATEHWLGGVAPTGPMAPSLAAINRLKLCKCCKSSALACGNRAQKLLTH